MYKCKYCDKEFDNKNRLGGHSVFCKNNPNYEQNLKKLETIRKNKKYKKSIKNYVCQYCGKEINNKGCLVLHERRCKLNPNYTPTEKQKLYIEKQKNKKPYKHSEEVKKKISEKRKKWLQEHKDEHPWKKSTKFISVPCENFKKFLREKNINFIEEYTPFDDYEFCIDIAFPDIKIGIEINGNQHYNKDGTLTEYYQNRHNILNSHNWTIYEIHYSKCYNINISNFEDILKLDIYDKNYVEQYFSNKKLKKQIKEKKKQQELEYKNKKRIEYENNCKKIIKDLLENSNIDFSKFGWVEKAKQYLISKNSLFNKKISSTIVHYFPNFYKDYNAFKRKN